MSGFNIGKIILGLQNPEFLLKKLKKLEGPKVPSFGTEMSSGNLETKPQQNQVLQNLKGLENLTQQLNMNLIKNQDRSIFIKNLLGLPQNLSEILLKAQNPNKPILGGTLGMPAINPELLQNNKVLNAIFDEGIPQINQQLTQEAVIAATTAAQNAKVPNDTVALFFSGMISLADISKLILTNSKQAVAGLIISMASASKQGMSNEQIQETLSVINSCISMAESNNPAQNLKSLMTLYLPWLPLSEQIGFDLEITTPDGETESNDSKLTVLIQTKNYGNLKGVFTLTTSNSVDVLIFCSENFPKKVLQKYLMDESSAHAMNTNIDIEEVSPKKEEINQIQETKVNLSATNEMNPYLLLIAHSFIRHTIIIDNEISID